jgi:AmmeMemoRadiSam system protein B
VDNRVPAVAGRFYPADPELLAREIAALSQADAARAPRPALGVMVPHAGYIYSGGIAAQTFAAVQPPARVLCMGPNHTGRGKPLALFPGNGFLLPGNSVAMDRALSDALLEGAELSWDRAAHEREHSIEVQLPFLRAQNPAVLVAALCLSRLSLAECEELGRSIASVLRRYERPPLLVASSDMSHYLSASAAKLKDGLAIKRILALDPAGLYRTVIEHDISMCGFVPTTVMLFAALALGASRAELVRYGNSGERSGDHLRVVGYAGVIVE